MTVDRLERFGGFGAMPVAGNLEGVTGTPGLIALQETSTSARLEHQLNGVITRVWSFRPSQHHLTYHHHHPS